MRFDEEAVPLIQALLNSQPGHVLREQIRKLQVSKIAATGDYMASMALQGARQEQIHKLADLLDKTAEGTQSDEPSAGWIHDAKYMPEEPPPKKSTTHG